MPESTIIAAALAFLVPLGYALIAVGGLQESRARQAALGAITALGLASLGYIATGFALQFGGVGLAHEQPGLDGLIWEWSALGTTWGSGWGMAGLSGWRLSGPAATSAAYALTLANLPWVMTAALVPVLALRGRTPAWAAGLIGLLMGAVLYPLAGNWIWGGGWLANLGANLGLGHGLVDAGGAGSVHLLAACTALAGILVFLPRRPRRDAGGPPIDLPPVHLPLLAVLGCGLLLAGGAAWVLANPLLDRNSLDLYRLALNMVLAAAGAGLLPAAYTWFVSGGADPLMATRGFAAGTIAGAAAAPFVPPWAALVMGVAVGLLVPPVIFLVNHVLRLDDPTASLAVHGLGGAWGLLAVGLFADGRAGAGWNGVGANAYLGVARQGVTGLLAASEFQPDWPAQLQAQVIGLAALALFGFFFAWLFVAPPAILAHALRWRLGHPSLGSPPAPREEPVSAEAGASEPFALVETGEPPAALPSS